MRAVVICAGPGDGRISSAKSIRKSDFSGDVLTCRTASDVRQQLQHYEDQAGVTVMLQYYLDQHPMGAKGAQAWHPEFMDALEAELRVKGLRNTPEIKTNINKDTGSVFLVCPWDRATAVQPTDVERFTLALESAFACKGWSVRPARKWWRLWK